MITERDSAEQGSDQGREVDRYLARVGDVHDVEVVGVDHVSGEVGQDSEGGADYGGDARGQAVHSVSEVDRVGHGRDDEDDDGHVDDHLQQFLDLAAAGGQPGVVELVVLPPAAVP